jgi:hypothetical protein
MKLSEWSEFSVDVLVFDQMGVLHLIVHQLLVHQFQILVFLHHLCQLTGQLLFLRLFLLVLLEQFGYWSAQRFYVLHFVEVLLFFAQLAAYWFGLASLLFHGCPDKFFMLLIKNASNHVHIIFKFFEQRLEHIGIDSWIPLF